MQVDLNVRTGAGTNYSIKKYKELTTDGKNHAYKQTYAVLKKGTTVTCKDVQYDGKGRIYIKLASGWICAKGDKGAYVKEKK